MAMDWAGTSNRLGRTDTFLVVRADLFCQFRSVCVRITARLTSGPARKALGLMLAAITITLFLLSLRRAGERAGRLGKRLSKSDRTH